MEEILAMLHKINERIDGLEASIAEMKINQQPMTSKDYIACLRKESGTELSVFLEGIKITVDNIVKLFEEKNPDAIFAEIDYTPSMRIFKNNKNTVYAFKDGKWQTMQKDELNLVQNTIFSKVRETYRAMVKEKNAALNDDKIKDLDYLEQRNIVSELNNIKHLAFKTKLYKIISDHTGQ